MIIHTPISITAVAVTTAATIIFIGLGFLPKPTRSGAMWSAAFANSMVASYLWTGADAFESIHVRGIANGLILASLALVWSGLRCYRGVSSGLGIALVTLVIMPGGMLLASFTDFFNIAFRGASVVTAVFAALTVIELLRLGSFVRDEVLPLLTGAALFIAFTAVSIVDGIMVALGITESPDSLLFIRGINFIGVNVFVVCNLVTLLLLSTRSGSTRTTPSHDVFETVARDRLQRAEATSDPWWSFIDIRLDDPEDLRVASSTAMFNEISEHFTRVVYEVLPADADIERMSSTRIIALVPRAQGGMREILSTLLTRITALEYDESLPLRLSASVGWSHVPTAEYNFDTLLNTTAHAARTAQESGGDRWERVHASS